METKTLFTFEELNEQAQHRALTETSAYLWDAMDPYYLGDSLRWWIVEQIATDDTGAAFAALFGRHATASLEWSLGYTQSDDVRILGRIYRADADLLPWPNDPDDDGPYLDLLRTPGTTGVWYETGLSETGRYLNENHPLTVAIRQLERDAHHYRYRKSDEQTNDRATRAWIHEQDRPRMFDAQGWPVRWQDWQTR